MAFVELLEDTAPKTPMGQPILKGAFDIILIGATNVVRSANKQRIVNIGTWRNDLRGNSRLTEAIDPSSQAATWRNAMTDENQVHSVSEVTLAADGWRSAAKDLEIARSLPDGWKGPASRKPSKDATDDAASILSAMAATFSAAARPVAPALGVDADGEIVMSWSGVEGLFGSMSISGDGTFAFYVKRGGSHAEGDSLPIASALPKPFVDVLLGKEAGRE